jgi:hypothetical protein
LATAPPPQPNTPQPAKVHTSPREVQINAQQVQPPSAVYLQPEDSLTLFLNNPVQSLAGSILNLNLRWLRPDGEISTARKPIVPGGGQTSYTFTLGEGFLLSASLTNPNTPIPEPGAVYATLVVVRDVPESEIFPWVLFSDYVTTYHFPSWPFGRNLSSQEGPGRIRSITGTTPAAGADINEVVPSGVRWRLFALVTTLTTSAAGGARTPDIVLDDGTKIFFRVSALQTQAASFTVSYVLGNMGSWTAIGTRNAWLFPDSILLSPAFRIRTITTAIDAADQWTAPQYLVQEWVNF